MISRGCKQKSYDWKYCFRFWLSEISRRHVCRFGRKLSCFRPDRQAQRNVLLCLVTQTFHCSRAAKQIVPRHRKTMAPSTNEQDICRHLAANKAAKHLFIYHVARQLTSQRLSTVKDYDKGLPRGSVIKNYFGFHEWLLAKFVLPACVE